MAVPEICMRRLQSDYSQLLTAPVDNVWAHPLEDNILEWHYVIRGPKDCPFADGLYHGKLQFPKDYPIKGPIISMLTPNGKFRCNSALCLSGISHFHPERWSPVQTVSSILIGILSFMIDDKCGPFAGQELQSIAKQKELALKSWAFNLNDKTFCKYFPQLVAESKQRLAQ